MVIRERGNRFCLERSVYEAAVLDDAGRVMRAGKRGTLYLGSVNRFCRFSNVPEELLNRLTDSERLMLKSRLSENEPKPDASLVLLPTVMQRAGEAMKVIAGSADIARHRELKRQFKNLQAAWALLEKDAQAAGVMVSRKGGTKAVAARS